MSREFGSFRKSPFGGFNRKDVIEYIEKMRNESFEYKKQVDETVKSLNEKIRELENAARMIEYSSASQAEEAPAEPAAQSFGDIGDATKHLKNVADELCRSLGDFMDKLSEKGLFDKALQEEPFAEEEEVQQEPDKISFVDGILASISFLGTSEKTEAPEEKTKTEEEKSISDLLSGFDFTK